MWESRSTQVRAIGLATFVVFLTFAWTSLSLAGRRPCVDVRIEAEHHVRTPHALKQYIFLPLKLTYHIAPAYEGRRITIPIAPGAAGLVVEHTGRDGTRTTQFMPLESRPSSEPDTLELQSSTLTVEASVWVLPGVHFDFSQLGIYRISHVHPWADQQKEPNSPEFKSNRLTIACVSQKRYDQLHAMLRQDARLALASYKFKNPPSAREDAKYRRSVPNMLDEAIKKGSRPDEVLFLLGSPDEVYYSKGNKSRIRDEQWAYEISRVGGYHVFFENGCVVRTERSSDWNGETPQADRDEG